jgi:hypothetical protein
METHCATSHSPQPCRGRPPSARPPVLLRASQIERVAAEEVDWLHTSTASGPTCDQARAMIRGWLETLSPFHREVIALRYDPTPWPEPVRDVLEGGFSLVVRVECERYRPAPHRTREQLEWAVSRRLQNRVLRYGARAVLPYGRRAEWHFGQAIREYAKARGREPSVASRLAIRGLS